MADEVGIRELKNSASKVIERVEGGDTVVVTKRGKPVARIIPAGLSPGMAQMIAEGRATWSGRKPKLPGPDEGIKLRGKGKSLSDYISEDRG
jgi:prevent-host-death family protein